MTNTILNTVLWKLSNYKDYVRACVCVCMRKSYEKLSNQRKKQI